MRVNLPLLTVGELCPADNPLKMIYDYPFEMIYVLSLWNDIWLSLRKKRQRPQSFWNDISTIALKWHFERNCLLHAFGVFRVFAYWILTKFNRQTPGWKNSLLSFRDDLWLSFRNERQRPQSFWNDISTILLKWQMTIFLKWAIQFCVPFDMIYDCHFEMTAQNFRTQNCFRQEKRPVFSWRKSPLNPMFSYTDFFAATIP